MEHVCFLILGTSLFWLLFRTPLFAEIEVFFYRGIALLGITGIVMLLGLVIYKKRCLPGRFTNKDVILSLVLMISSNLVFFTHLPVTAERSISVFLLGYLNEHSQTILTEQKITQAFTDKYLYEDKAVEKRLREQVVSGTVMVNGGGYKISERGRALMKVYALMADVFRIDKKLIFP